jgi:hypothetical protein
MDNKSTLIITSKHSANTYKKEYMAPTDALVATQPNRKSWRQNRVVYQNNKYRYPCLRLKVDARYNLTGQSGLPRAANPTTQYSKQFQYQKGTELSLYVYIYKRVHTHAWFISQTDYLGWTVQCTVPPPHYVRKPGTSPQRTQNNINAEKTICQQIQISQPP